MNSPQPKAKAAPFRPRRAALNWVDFLVIAATALVFAAVVANNTHAARAQTGSTVIPASQLPAQETRLGEETGLIKARIGLALATR